MSGDANTNGGILPELEPEQKARLFIELVAFSSQERGVDRTDLLKIAEKIGPRAVSQCVNSMVQNSNMQLEIDE